MYGLLLLLHILGAAVWTGGHLVLSIVVLPKALKARSVEMLPSFEALFEKIGMPALVLQVLTGLTLAYFKVPDVTLWFDVANPTSHGIMAKLSLLVLTLGFAIHARFRVMPKLSAETLPVMAWHIIL